MYVYACIWRARACVALVSQRPDDEYTPESHARSYACTLKEDAETLAKTLDFYNAAFESTQMISSTVDNLKDQLATIKDKMFEHGCVEVTKRDGNTTKVGFLAVFISKSRPRLRIWGESALRRQN